MVDKNDVYKTLISDGEQFINNVIQKKYLLDGENDYDDIINHRFFKELEKSMESSKLKNMKEILLSKRVITAGSISFGLGNDTVKCSLSNCYYIPIKEDSIEGIYECCGKIARTFSYRGGCGIDITILRPKESKVRNAASLSTGSVSFMPTFSDTSHTIGQSGRRGALIITLDIRHPDILDFIWCKSKPEQVFGKDVLTGKIPDVSNANISIKLTNDFISAVEKDKQWSFVFPDYHSDEYSEWNGNYDDWLEKGYKLKKYNTINARDLLKQIAEAAWISGDPGISYWDNVIKWTPSSFDPLLKPRGFNP